MTALSVYVLRDNAGHHRGEPDAIIPVIATSAEQARRSIVFERGVLHPTIDELAAFELVGERRVDEPGVVCECEVRS